MLSIVVVGFWDATISDQQAAVSPRFCSATQRRFGITAICNYFFLHPIDVSSGVRVSGTMAGPRPGVQHVRTS
ncbi:hypothetical protein RRG08_032502 [Elysia crispata]|uniref:Uncharacterized protein n=1 Tax=Elysia crispata TaxID=231223 RepID=A0AAE0ZXA0_9GAST|nr:hypothetical protein RRG08_032502 [Elysia crispata]